MSNEVYKNNKHKAKELKNRDISSSGTKQKVLKKQKKKKIFKSNENQELFKKKSLENKNFNQMQSKDLFQDIETEEDYVFVDFKID